MCARTCRLQALFLNPAHAPPPPLCATVRYNYQKLQSMKEAASLSPAKSEQQLAEAAPLKGGEKEAAA